VTASAQRVKMKKRAPSGDLASVRLTPVIMWATPGTAPKSEPRSMITYPDRRSPSVSVPYSQTTKMPTPIRFAGPTLSIPRATSSDI
jgi:hypothetical protein